MSCGGLIEAAFPAGTPLNLKLTSNWDLLSRCLEVSPGLLNKLKSVEYMHGKVPKIRQQPTADQKVTELLDILDEVPDGQQQSVFSTLLSALRQDGQEHVANIFLPESDARPMSDEHYQLLVSKQQQVRQCLDPLNGIIDELVKKEIFSHKDKNNIMGIKGFDGKSKAIIDTIKRKPDAAFDKFINALVTTKQEHVVLLLGYQPIPMTDEHRDLLTNKKGELVKFMDPTSELIDLLINADILNSYHLAEIKKIERIEEMCHFLIDILQRKPDAAFDKFVRTLVATKQEHVASLLGYQTSNIPITDEHRKLLISKKDKLSQFINPTGTLLNKLEAVEVFNNRDINNIASKSSYTEMSTELVNILLRKSDSSFDRFIEALNNTEQQHVVHILTGQGESPLSHLRRLVLRKARDRLVSRVDTLHTSLIPKLISSGVLTDADKEQIVTHKVNEDRTAELVDVTARKSQLAYDKFIQALKDSGHREVAELLEGLELRGRIDPHFLSNTLLSDRKTTIQLLRNGMKSLVSGIGNELESITKIMKHNGFAVSEIQDGSIYISFRCFGEESLENLKRLYSDKTLDKLLTEVFCPPFADQGLESLTLCITDSEFQTLAAVFEMSRKMTSLSVELLELVLMRTFMKLFNDHFKTHEAIRLAYSSLAAVCNNWWQTMNGWPQSTTKHWLKHKLHRTVTVVCRPYVVTPSLPSSLSVPSQRVVYSVTVCDNKLFALCYNSILVFEANSNQPTTIELEQFNSPRDIVSCTETQQLYVAGRSRDSTHCVWRVSLDGRQVVKWLPNKSTTTTTQFTTRTLSVTSRRLLVTSPNNELLWYEADGVELKRVPLPDMTSLSHAVETSRETFIISNGEPQPRVCEVNVVGGVIRTCCDQQQLSYPIYLAFDSGGRIFVAEYDKHRVLLLNSETLELERVLLDTQQHQLTERPERLCYIQQTGQLAVVGRCDFIQLFTVL